MSIFNFRKATLNDIPFLVETIIEAEKSGTNILPYTTIFRLSETESKKYITDMFLEEIDGCQLSISSYMITEQNRKSAGAIGSERIPSSIFKTC